MTPTPACFALIKKFEGCRLTAYPDPATGGDPWTIGYGHTGPEVKRGFTIGQNIADAYLLKDVQWFADGVSACVTLPIAQQRMDAMVSLAYNIGLKAFRNSTLLRMVNKGDLVGAADEFLKWNHANGKVMPGLTARRLAERSLFIGADGA